MGVKVTSKGTEFQLTLMNKTYNIILVYKVCYFFKMLRLHAIQKIYEYNHIIYSS